MYEFIREDIVIKSEVRVNGGDVGYGGNGDGGGDGDFRERGDAGECAGSESKKEKRAAVVVERKGLDPL